MNTRVSVVCKQVIETMGNPTNVVSTSRIQVCTSRGNVDYIIKTVSGPANKVYIQLVTSSTGPTLIHELHEAANTWRGISNLVNCPASKQVCITCADRFTAYANKLTLITDN